METIYEEEHFTPDQLPGYVSPSCDKGHAPRVNRTIVDADEPAVGDGWLENAWKRVEDMRDEVLNIEKCNQLRDETERLRPIKKEKQSRTKRKGVQRKTGWGQMSCIPIPIFWVNPDISRCLALKLGSRSRQAAFKPFRIPVSNFQTSSVVDKGSAVMKPKAVHHDGEKRSHLPMKTKKMQKDCSQKDDTTKKASYSVYHLPGRHITLIPQRLDSLWKPKMSRLTAWMNTLRKSLTRSEVKIKDYHLHTAQKVPPVAANHNEESKGSPIKRTKGAVVEKFGQLSPKSSFSNLDNFFNKKGH